MAKTLQRYALTLATEQRVPCRQGHTVEAGVTVDPLTGAVGYALWRVEGAVLATVEVVLVGEGDQVPGGAYERRGSIGLNNERRTVLQVYTTT